MPGPMIQSSPTTRRSIGQWCAFSTSITTSTSGASRLVRCSAVKEKLITRAGLPARSQPKSESSSTTRFSTSPPYRVGCLVSMATSTRRSASATVSSSLRSVSTLPSVGVELGRLVVDVGPRVLPPGEVQLVELGEVHRRDEAARGRRTPQVAVVDADQVAVGRQAHVALERLGTGSMARVYARRVCSAVSSLAPRWATTCGLMRRG